MLNKNIVEEYQKNGVVFLKNIIDKTWIKELKIGVEKNFKNPSKFKCVYETDNDQEVFYDDYCNWNRIEEYKNFIYNSNIANISSNLMI